MNPGKSIQPISADNITPCVLFVLQSLTFLKVVIPLEYIVLPELLFNFVSQYHGLPLCQPIAMRIDQVYTNWDILTEFSVYGR